MSLPTLSLRFQLKAQQLRALGITPKQLAQILSELTQAREQRDPHTPLAAVLERHQLGTYTGEPPELYLTQRGRLVLELAVAPL